MSSRRIAPGHYETATGHRVQRVEATHAYPSSWMLIPAGEDLPTDAFPTKREAMASADALDGPGHPTQEPRQ